MAEMNTTATVKTVINGEQAEKQLEKLTADAKELKQAISKAFLEGDSKNQKKFEKALRDNQKEAKLLRAAMFDVNKVLANLKTSSVNDLNKALRSLNNELNSGKIKRGSKEWTELQNKIRAVRGELRSIQSEQQAVTSRWGRMSDAFNKYGAMAASAIAAITGVTMALNKMNEMAREKEDRAANLKALTGLDDSSIAWLTQQAEVLSTTMTDEGVRIRKSATEILDAYTMVGGAKPELLANKDALLEVTKQTMILAEASKMDLLDAVNGVTLAMNQFSAGAEQAERFTNALAAGAQAGSAEVANVSAALAKTGVAAAQANLSIEETVGCIETLSEFGIKDQIAGTGMKSFFLKLQAGADDTNPKIVGLETALHNLNEKNLSAVELQKMFGLEAYNVASILIQNADKVSHYTEAVTGTNAAIEQATVNSDTAAAKMAQLRNELNEAGIAIAKKLSPYVIRLGSTFKNTVVILTQLIDFLEKYGVIVVSATASLAAYTIAMKANVIQAKLVDLWNTKLLVSFNKLKIALMSNPWGIAITLASTLAATFYTLRNRTKEVIKEYSAIDDAMSKANDSYVEQSSKIKSLCEITNNEVLSIDKRREALNELKKIIPDYHADLTDEGVLINNNKTAIDNYLTSLEKTIKLQALSDKMTELYKKKFELEENKRENTESNYETFELNGETIQIKKNIETQHVATQQLDFQQNLAESVSNIVDSQLAAIDEEIKKLENRYKEINIGNVTNTTDDSNTVVEDNVTDNNVVDEYSQQINAIQQKLQERSNLLRQARVDDTITEKDFNEGIKALALESLQETLNLTKARYGEDSIEYQNALARKLEAEEEFNNILARCDADADAERLRQEEETQQKIAEFKRKYGLEDTMDILDQELAILQQYYDQKLISEEEFQQLKQNIINKYSQTDNSGNIFPNGIFGGEDNQQKIMNEAFGAFNDITSAISDLWKTEEQEQLAAIDAKYDKEIERAGNNKDLVAKLEKQKEAEKAAVQAEYADKQFGIQISQALAQAALSIIQCFAQLGPIAGAIAAVAVGVTTGLQIATMNKQRQAAKANYWSGGFTPSGDWDEPQGEVHSDEFIANRFAVKNPNVRKVLNVIDKAQKNNTIASLRSEDISSAINPGIATVAAMEKISSNPTNSKEMIAVNKKLQETLDKGIMAFVTIEGPNGFEQNYKKYQTLQKNKSW